jgi:hypothetical protein
MGSEKLPVNSRKRGSKISEPLAPQDWNLPSMICARVG